MLPQLVCMMYCMHHHLCIKYSKPGGPLHTNAAFATTTTCPTMCIFDLKSTGSELRYNSIKQRHLFPLMPIAASCPLHHNNGNSNFIDHLIESCAIDRDSNLHLCDVNAPVRLVVHPFKPLNTRAGPGGSIKRGSSLNSATVPALP